MTRFVHTASFGCRISDGRPPPNLPQDWGGDRTATSDPVSSSHHEKRCRAAQGPELGLPFCGTAEEAPHLTRSFVRFTPSG
jgi:hypothetical protein